MEYGFARRLVRFPKKKCAGIGYGDSVIPCSKRFTPRSHNAQRCDDCRKQHDLARERNRKQRNPVSRKFTVHDEEMIQVAAKPQNSLTDASGKKVDAKAYAVRLLAGGSW